MTGEINPIIIRRTNGAWVEAFRGGYRTQSGDTGPRSVPFSSNETQSFSMVSPAYMEDPSLLGKRARFSVP